MAPEPAARPRARQREPRSPCHPGGPAQLPGHAGGGRRPAQPGRIWLVHAAWAGQRAARRRADRAGRDHRELGSHVEPDPPVRARRAGALRPSSQAARAVVMTSRAGTTTRLEFTDWNIRGEAIAAPSDASTRPAAWPAARV